MYKSACIKMFKSDNSTPGVSNKYVPNHIPLESSTFVITEQKSIDANVHVHNQRNYIQITYTTI